MEKRVILAFVLSLAVVWAFQGLFMPTPPPVSPTAPAQEGAPAEPVAPAPAAATAATTTNPTTISAAAPPAASDISAPAAEDVVIDTTLYSATLSNVGGVLKSFKLKAYTDTEGKAIELVDSTSSENLGWPLATVSGDAAVDPILSKANFKVQREGTRIQFEFAGGGLYARKVLDFSQENYELTLESTLTRDGSKVPHRVAWQGRFGDQSVDPDPATTFAVVSTDSEFERIPVGDIEGVLDRTTTIAGVEDRYFLSAFILPQPAAVQIAKQDYTGPDGEVVGTFKVASPVLDNPIRVYVGPKDEEVLARTDPRLPATVDYGYFEVITRPLLVALLWINNYVGNFGWAIILLTIAINFLLFPLRLKQQVSMQKMQKLQPQMKTLQDRYKKLKATDPRRAEVQSEMMNLYKQNGVNPLGGCLPLLLQMPLLFAFWNMLSVSIEMRGAPWILWIRDLSQPEKLYITDTVYFPLLPILMAVTMIITTKMTPTTMDPAQAKMMMIMPVMLTFMFLWLQSGVTLYYLTSNVVGIGQQWFIKKYWSGDESDTKKPKRDGKKKSLTE